MITESGMFTPMASICLTISEHHPESWNPALTARSIITALFSFMLSNELDGVPGTCKTNNATKKKMAQDSKANIMKHKIFKLCFLDMGKHIGLGPKPKVVKKVEMPEKEADIKAPKERKTF